MLSKVYINKDHLDDHVIIYCKLNNIVAYVCIKTLLQPGKVLGIV